MRKRCLFNNEASLVGYTHTRVRFSEIDSMKIVWHGVYVRYFEDGREAFGREYPGIGYMDIYNSGYSAPIVDLQFQYLKPLRINDEIIIETRYIDKPGAKMCYEYTVKKVGTEELVERGSTMQVFLDPNGDMCLNNPPFYDEWKRKWIK